MPGKKLQASEKTMELEREKVLNELRNLCNRTCHDSCRKAFDREEQPGME